MRTLVNEFPKRPLPHEPGPSRPQVQPPTVFVYEPQQWEYKVVGRAADQPLTEAELNALGKDGWELAGIVSQPESVQFYLKRLRD
jgi:hypothetical protein